MRNIVTKVTAGKLTITVDLKAKGETSKSGKSEVIATTNGNAPVEGTDVKFGLNVFKSKK